VTVIAGFARAGGEGEVGAVDGTAVAEGESALLGADVVVVVEDGSTTRTTPLIDV
jgi:hypothetical protein